jgi:hypothetical protein
LLLSADFAIIFLKDFIHNGNLVRLKKFCTDSHYKKSIAQVASKVKSFPITYGCEFSGIKKGVSGGRCWGDFAVFGEQLSGK